MSTKEAITPANDEDPFCWRIVRLAGWVCYWTQNSYNSRYSLKMFSTPRVFVLFSRLLVTCSASHCNQTMYPLPYVGVTEMAQGSYLACGCIDLTYERRICELQNVADTKVLSSLGNIVGQASYRCNISVLRSSYIPGHFPSRRSRRVIYYSHPFEHNVHDNMWIELTSIQLKPRHAIFHLSMT